MWDLMLYQFPDHCLSFFTFHVRRLCVSQSYNNDISKFFFCFLFCFFFISRCGNDMQISVDITCKSIGS